MKGNQRLITSDRWEMEGLDFCDGAEEPVRWRVRDIVRRKKKVLTPREGAEEGRFILNA